jgi:hypothetical protein
MNGIRPFCQASQKASSSDFTQASSSLGSPYTVMATPAARQYTPARAGRSLLHRIDSAVAARQVRRNGDCIGAGPGLRRPQCAARVGLFRQGGACGGARPRAGHARRRRHPHRAQEPGEVLDGGLPYFTNAGAAVASLQQVRGRMGHNRDYFAPALRAGQAPLVSSRLDTY